MTGETRKKLGKDFAEGKTTNYEEHYQEFKDEIDAELKPVEEEETTKSKRKK